MIRSNTPSASVKPFPKRPRCWRSTVTRAPVLWEFVSMAVMRWALSFAGFRPWVAASMARSLAARFAACMVVSSDEFTLAARAVRICLTSSGSPGGGVRWLAWTA